MERIQIIVIIAAVGFLGYIARLIKKGKLREEYSIIWVICAIVIVVFTFWRESLDKVASAFGVYAPPNLIFTVAIFAVFVYLLHLSVVISKLQEQNKKLSQKIALLEEEKKQQDAGK